MLRLDDLIVMSDRKALRIGQRLLELGGQFIQTHAEILGRSMLMPGKWGWSA